jgi:hypothetical protein
LLFDFESVALKCLGGYRGWSWKNVGVLKIGRSTFYRLVVGLPTFAVLGETISVRVVGRAASPESSDRQ